MPRYDLYEAPWYSSTSPGDSSVPANMLPIITQCAPAAIALAMSPEKRMPPSAISGTPCGASAAAMFATALICGTPTPATMRVVQIEPGPMPTLTASAPASINASAASPVTMLPAITCCAGQRALMRRTVSITPLRMAVRRVDDDHVHAAVAQRRRTIERVGTGADGRADAQRAALVLAGAREFRGLLEVLDGDHALEAVIVVDDQHLLDPMLVQQRQHLFLRRILAHGDQPLARRHDGRKPARRSASRSAGRDA